MIEIIATIVIVIMIIIITIIILLLLFLCLLFSLSKAKTVTNSFALLKAASGGAPHENMHTDLTEEVKVAIGYVDELIVRNLLSPLVDAMSAHVRTVTVGMLKEGVSRGKNSSGGDDEVDCSRAVQTLLQQVHQSSYYCDCSQYCSILNSYMLPSEISYFPRAITNAFIAYLCKY